MRPCNGHSIPGYEDTSGYRRGMTEGRRRLRDRSTADLLVLMIAGTICGGLIATGAFTAVFVLLNPGVDISGPARLIADVVNTLIGLLAGFMAGRTGALSGGEHKPEPKGPP